MDDLRPASHQGMRADASGDEVMRRCMNGQKVDKNDRYRTFRLAARGGFVRQ